jgi:hypothetical protein
VGYAGQTHWYDPMMYLKYFHPRVDAIIALSDVIKKVLTQNMIGGKTKSPGYTKVMIRIGTKMLSLLTVMILDLAKKDIFALLRGECSSF